jgi:hypothetical protein
MPNKDNLERFFGGRTLQKQTPFKLQVDHVPFPLTHLHPLFSLTVGCTAGRVSRDNPVPDFISAVRASPSPLPSDLLLSHNGCIFPLVGRQY